MITIKITGEKTKFYVSLPFLCGNQLQRQNSAGSIEQLNKKELKATGDLYFTFVKVGSNSRPH